jgi:hypothetical protein
MVCGTERRRLLSSCGVRREGTKDTKTATTRLFGVGWLGYLRASFVSFVLKNAAGPPG